VTVFLNGNNELGMGLFVPVNMDMNDIGLFEFSKSFSSGRMGIGAGLYTL
jgi:hypothetical protein